MNRDTGLWRIGFWSFFRVFGSMVGFWFFLMLMVLCNGGAFGQGILELKVLTSRSLLPLPGASVKVNGMQGGFVADGAGLLRLKLAYGSHRMEVSHQGYATRIVAFRLASDTAMVVELSELSSMLDSVVVSTGYQRTGRAELTGSFGVVDRKLLERRVGANLLERLEDVVPGLVFNRSIPSGSTNISIRGQATISAGSDPLIVLDDFPFEGELSAINPNDIESVTVLKDAAASSIWGARAGNGVIVLRSKAGKLGSKISFGLNANLTIGDRPDLFYLDRMSSSDYVDLQSRLFAEGFYRGAEQADLGNVSHAALPELVEMLILARDGKLDAGGLAAQVDRLRGIDVRNDISRYLYRPMVNQQYALNASGGGPQGSFYVSMGLDRGTASQRGNSSERISLNAKLDRMLFSGRLQLQLGLFRSESGQDNNALAFFTPVSPYQQLADANGSPLSVPRYRQGFVDRSMQKGFLDWNYVPLEEARRNDHTMRSVQERYDFGAVLKLLEGLKFSARYQYDASRGERRELYGQNHFFTRNMINTYTQVRSDGSLERPVPLGGILDQSNSQRNGHVLRGQADLVRRWGEHSLNAIGGYERRFANGSEQSYRLYGYQQDFAVSRPVDYLGVYQSAAASASRLTIPYGFSAGGSEDRFVSYYANAVYSFKSRYVLSASGRMDKSNLFGVATNQKGVPLYSIGAAWTMSSEPFWKSRLVEMLKVRASFGYNGNIDRNLSAQTTALYFPVSADPANVLIGQGYARIENPPNPELRWERVRTVNLGADMSTLSGALSATVDAYTKDGMDLIGPTAFPGSSGVKRFVGNFASTRTRGLDVMLNGRPFAKGFSWESNLLFSMAREKVTAYRSSVQALNYLRNIGTPVAGRPLYSLSSYADAGLDPLTGDPRGFVNGQPSSDYAAIINGTDIDGLVYHGSMRPVFFGAFRNTFGYKGFSVSVSISYRAGYYFRRPSISYGTSYGLESGHGDYARRWQVPGDELWTSVPSLPKVTNDRRDSFYSFSQGRVEKGDHIRLQDINLNYTLPTAKGLGGLAGLQLYVYANNLGLLYKRASGNIDPDYRSASPPVRTIAFGLRKQFN